MSKMIYRVEGMTCGGCVKSLTNALETALPNTGIEVLLDGGRVTITGKHDAKQVEDAVEDAGFDFVGAEA